MGTTCYISGKRENWKALEPGSFVQEVWWWCFQEKTEVQLSLNPEIGKGSALVCLLLKKKIFECGSRPTGWVSTSNNFSSQRAVVQFS